MYNEMVDLNKMADVRITSSLFYRTLLPTPLSLPALGRGYALRSACATTVAANQYCTADP